MAPLQTVNPLRDLFEAYEDGHAALLLEERSLYDLTCDAEGRLVPAIEVLRCLARSSCGMHVITYSMAQGLDWDSTRLTDRAERTRVEDTLRLNGLLEVPQDQNEIVRVLRGVASMARARRDDLRWSDGQPMRFAFVLEFAEHLAPGTLTRIDEQILNGTFAPRNLFTRATCAPADTVRGGFAATGDGAFFVDGLGRVRRQSFSSSQTIAQSPDPGRITPAGLIAVSRTIR